MKIKSDLLYFYSEDELLQRKGDVMNEFPLIEKNKIILRKLEISDYNSYLDYVTDDKISSQFNFDYNEESAKLRLEELVEKYSQERKPYIWAIALKDTNEFIGIITIDTWSTANKRFSLAYGIRALYRGNNYAYLACEALIDFIFKNFDMHRLELAHRVGNIASQRTIEKLGAKFEGIARESKFYNNQFKDRKVYSILKQEWLERENDELSNNS